MKKAFEGQILGILDAKNLHQCGEALEAFVDGVEKLSDAEDQAECVDTFYNLLYDRVAVQLDFDAADDKGWHICPAEQRVATYVAIGAIYQDSVEENLDHLRKCAQELKENFSQETGTCVVDEAFLGIVLEYMEKKYSYFSRVFAEMQLEFLLLSDAHKDGMAYTVVRHNAKADMLVPYFCFFAGSAVSHFSDLLWSDAYTVLHQLCNAAVMVAYLGQAEDMHNPTIPEAWHEVMKESGVKLREHGLAHDLTMAIIAEDDFPFRKGPLFWQIAEDEEKKGYLRAHKELLHLILNSLQEGTKH